MPRINIAPGVSISDFDYTATVGMEEARDGNALVAYSHEYRAFISVPAGGSVTQFALTFPVASNIADKDIVAEAQKLAQKHSAFIGRINGRLVTLVPMLPAVAEIRKRIADLLSTKRLIHPWDIEVEATWSAVEPRIETLVVRTRELDIDADKAEDVWRKVILRLPGGSNGWTVAMDMLTGVVRLTYGKQRTLPGVVRLEEILPDAVQPDLWYRSAFGIATSGDVAAHNLKSAPHTILAGPTNSGKTNTIVMMLASRLMHGHDLVIIDPIKGVDFKSLAPFARFVAGTYEDSVDAMDWLIEEAERRKAVLLAHGAVNWFSLPEDVRTRENIKPITVVIDELGQLFSAVKVNAALPKDHPRRLKQESVSISKALLDSGTGEIGRAYRFVGLFLVLASQKLLAKFLGDNGTELRSNCGNGVYLHPPGTDVDKGDLDLLFDSTVEKAMENIVTLDDGHSYGLAVTVAEGTGMSAARVAFAEPKAVPGILRERGLQDAVPLVLGGAGSNSAPSTALARPAAPASPPSWDDLDDLEPAPVPVPDFIP